MKPKLVKRDVAREQSLNTYRCKRWNMFRNEREDDVKIIIIKKIFKKSEQERDDDDDDDDDDDEEDASRAINLVKMLANIFVSGGWGRPINLTTATTSTTACFNKPSADWRIRAGPPPCKSRKGVAK